MGLWGSRSSMREFLLVDDVADAVYFLTNQMVLNLNNVKMGKGITIEHIAELIQDILGV